MNRRYLTEGTRVKVSPGAEYLAGMVAYVVAVAPGTDHPYCMNPSRTSGNIATSYWLRAQDVTAVNPKRRPSPPKPATPAAKVMTIGSYVKVDTTVPFGPDYGFIQAMTRDAVCLTRNLNPEAIGNIWLRRQYVTLV